MFPNQEMNETVWVTATLLPLPLILLTFLQGFNLAHNANKTLWEYYALHPTLGKRFANAMKFYGSSWGDSVSFLVTGYPWASLSPGSTIIDVDGSEGHASITIAEKYLHLNFVVQDLMKVVKKSHLGPELTESVAKRITYQVHDFLATQELQGDVYLYRQIFHNWPDKYVVKILRNLIPVLKEGARVVIKERLMLAPGSVPIVTERQVR
jgi:hypothetical protein